MMTTLSVITVKQDHFFALVIMMLHKLHLCFLLCFLILEDLFLLLKEKNQLSFLPDTSLGKKGNRRRGRPRKESIPAS